MKARWVKLIKAGMVALPGEKEKFRPNKGSTVNILLGGGEFSSRSQNLDAAAPAGYCSPVDSTFDLVLDLSNDDFLLVYRYVPDITAPNVRHVHHISWEKIADIVFSERFESGDRLG